MRNLALVLTAIVLGTLPAFADPPATPSPAPPASASPAEPRWRQDLAAFDATLAKQRIELATARERAGTREGVAALLALMYRIDQEMRKEAETPWKHGYGGTPEANEFLKVLMLERWAAVDTENTTILRELLDRWGWFDRRTWGDTTDDQAWTMVQHADRDVAFQKQVLALLEPLATSGGTRPDHFAYLYDRVAVNEKRPQRYGTQGSCTGPGTWRPAPMEDAAGVDAKRKEMGLRPLAEYIAGFRDICHEDQSAR